MTLIDDGEVLMTQFCYFAQPIENIRNNKIIMYELLLRAWCETDKRWVVPETFDLEPDMVIQLLEEALRVLGDCRISINLTKKQFSDLKIAQSLVEFVRTYLEPRQLTVELVEVPSLETLKLMSEVYRSAGIMLAIDDVGSDNTAEAINGLLPYVNTLKFALQNLREHRYQMRPEYVEALKFWFDKAEDEQVLFTFEGIESKADIELAVQIGITRGQGYLFSRPLEPRQLKQ